MPAATTVSQAAKNERDDRLRDALKAHILKERQRKKEDHEAEIENERLRKEREEQERQHVMTLGETREQIQKLDQRLDDLKNQKDQLCLQLKKVLNKQQQQKQKDSELSAMQAMQSQNMQQQGFPSSRVARFDKNMHQMVPPMQNNPPVKRGRSQSPPPHQNYYNKNSGYSQPQKHDDGRRGGADARILWNKPPTQYQMPGTLFYQTSTLPSHTQPDSRGPPPSIIYPAYSQNMRPNYHIEMAPQSQPGQSHPHKSEQPPQQQHQKPTQIYHINLDQPPISSASGPIQQVAPQQHSKSQMTMDKMQDRGGYHVEVKMDQQPHHGPPPPQPQHLPEGVVYTPLMSSIPMHPGVMQMQANQSQNSKTGSITQGYPPSRGGPPPQMSGQPPQNHHYQRRMY